MHLQLLELLQNYIFLKKLLGKVKNSFLDQFFQQNIGETSRLAVCPSQVQATYECQLACSLLYQLGTLRTVTTYPCNFHPRSPLQYNVQPWFSQLAGHLALLLHYENCFTGSIGRRMHKYNRQTALVLFPIPCACRAEISGSNHAQ